MRRQVREAERLLEELNANPGVVPKGAQPQPNGSATPPPTNLPAVTIEPVTAPPAAAAPPAEPPPTAQPVAQPDALAELQHKHRVLEGKYNAETSRLLGAAQALKDENQRLLDQLRQHQQPPQNTPPTQPVDRLAGVITEKERTEYGQELIDLMSRIAAAQSGAEITRLTQELERMKGTVRVTVAESLKTQQDRVYEALARWNPDWQTINISQEFVDWLSAVDVMSGTSRKNGLTSAFEAGDAQRVVGIFRRFEEDSRSRATAPPAAPAVDPATLLAPGQPRGTGGEAPTGQSERIWDEDEIDHFYSRVQRNRISPEEKKATEAEIHKAMVAGRIRPRGAPRPIQT